MPDLVKFSDLKDSQPLTLNGDDLVAVAHKEQASTTGYSSMTTTPTQLSQYAVEEQTFVNLKTSSKTVETSINQTISNLADDYDNTDTYDVDDCVLYEGNLYKCITAIPVAEEWNSTHWEQVKAVDVGSGGGGELPTYEKSASGSVVSFTDGGDNIPVKSLIVDITAIQAGSGIPSPSNVRAISGFDTVELVKSGLNIWNEQWEVGTINANTGLPEADNSRVRSKDFILCKPSTSYYALPNVQVFGYDLNKDFVGIVSSSTSGAVFTTPANCYYFKFRTPNTYGNTYNNDLGINYPSTITNYKKYKGTTYTIALGSTVYQGTLDVVNGVLTITHALLDMGSVDWVKSEVGDYSVFYYVVSDKDDTFDFICSCFNAVEKTRSQLADLEIGTYNSTNAMNRLTVRYDAISTSADFKTAVTGQYVVYRLATPVVSNLTPTEVRTLLGENNIYANSGDVTVEYFNEDADEVADLAKAVCYPRYTEYTGTPTSNIQSDSVSPGVKVTKVDYGSVEVWQVMIGGVHPINGISSSTEYTRLYTFEKGIIPDALKDIAILVWGKDSAFTFTRMEFRSETNYDSIGLLYGYSQNAWFAGEKTIYIRKEVI